MLMRTKKTLATTSLVVLLLSVAACSSEEPATPTQDPPANSSTSTPEPTTEPELVEEVVLPEKTELGYEWRAAAAGSQLDVSQAEIVIPEDVSSIWGPEAGRKAVDSAFETVYASTYVALQPSDSEVPVVDYSYLQSLMSAQGEADFVAGMTTEGTSNDVYELTPVKLVEEGELAYGRMLLKFDGATAPELSWNGMVTISTSSGKDIFGDDEPRLTVKISYDYVYEGQEAGAEPARAVIPETRTVWLAMKPIGDQWALDKWSSDITSMGGF